MLHSIKLFSFIPFINAENRKNKTKIKFLGIPILTIKKKDEKVLFLLFGFIPVFSVLNLSSYSAKKKTQDYEAIIERIKSKIAHKEKIVVVFFINEVSKWKTITLYNVLKNDNRFDVKLLISYPLSHKKVRFIKSCYIENIKSFFNKHKYEYCYIEPTNKKLFQKYIKNADILFMPQPWGLNTFMQPQNITNCLIYYMPYFVPNINNMLLDYQIDFHPYLFRYYVTNKIWEFQFKKYAFDTFKIRADNIVGLGHTQLDNYQNISETENKGYVIYAPHISFYHPGNEKENILDYTGTFDVLKDDILSYAKKTKKEISWVWKPHPGLKDRLINKTKIMTEDEVNKYYKEWEDLGIACYDADYVPLFRQSKCLITDCRSFTIEYFVTQKPIIRLVSSHFGIPLPPQVEEIYDTFYNAYNIEDLYHFIDEVVIKENDYLREKRLAVLKKQGLLTSQATENIYKDIKHTLGMK